MIILTIRTDKPEAELGIYKDQEQQAYETWQAHRELAETIHLKLKELLASQKLALQDISGVAVYQGPGSFTGLRIGISVANALAASLNIPLCGAENETWLKDSLDKLLDGKNEQMIAPAYGADVHITLPKH